MVKEIGNRINRLRALALGFLVSSSPFALGAGAVATHALARLTGQPLPLAVLAASQLGVPVAAATLGTQTHSLAPGEAPALMLGALLTIAVAAIASTVLSASRASRPRS